MPPVTNDDLTCQTDFFKFKMIILPTEVISLMQAQFHYL